MQRCDCYKITAISTRERLIRTQVMLYVADNSNFRIADPQKRKKNAAGKNIFWRGRIA
jgi:hypothetical protein